MKIGIDARLFRSSAAGIGRYSENLIKNLLEIDPQNEYVLFMTPADRKEASVQLASGKNYRIVEVDIPHYSLAEQTKLAKIIEKEKCDLVHFLNFNFPVRYRGKFIVTIHDLTLIFYPEAANKTGFFKQKAFNFIIKKACQNATKIIAVSKNTKKDIVNYFKVEASKISVIYEAADDKKFNVREKLSPSKNPIILYVGQFRRHKNIDRLIKAFEIVRKDIPVRLVLLGKVPTDFRVDKEEILRDIEMPGFVSDQDLAEWFGRADVFVFPSLYEGFGLPGLEAMAAGVPVASSNRASLPEIYGEAALYFDPLKPQEIADRIKMILQNDQLRQGLIEKGKVQAKKYSWQKAAKETLKLYSEV